jgi:uncharacterized membrane protein
MPDNGTALDNTKTTSAKEGAMEGSSGPSKWMWLVPLVFFVFLVLALSQGAFLSVLGWFCLLVNGVLVASGYPDVRERFYTLLLPFSSWACSC